MILMTKGDVTKFVCDAFVESYRADGFMTVSEAAQAKETAEAVSFPVTVEETVEETAELDKGSMDANLDKAEKSIPSPSAVKKTVEVEVKEVASPKEKAKDPEGFACLICGKTYTRKSSLDKHIKEKHSK